MAGIEAAAFAKTYATLKPNQQPNATQAFALMAGIFQAAAPSSVVAFPTRVQKILK